MKTQTWRQVIIELNSKQEYVNPFLDVSIMAVFTGPNGEKVKREAYWDGGCNYKVSFAPTVTGIWTYVISAPEETGLHGEMGTVECVPYEGELAIYKHGFLKVKKGSRYLMHNDDTPFFWLGDTHWNFAHETERWAESNHPGMTSMFRGMADKRASQGYNVYQTNLRSEPDWVTGITEFWVNEREDDLPNLEYYQNELDRRMLYLADLGFVNALGLSWYAAVGANGEHIEHVKHLARYIIARYGALPMVWTLAGEASGYQPNEDKRYIYYWREVAKYIEAMDGYENLQTSHALGILPYQDHYENEDWFDFTLNQAGHGNFLICGENYKSWFGVHPNKPFVEGESMYEGLSTLEPMGPRCVDDAIVRRIAYTAIQSGCCGYTYGAQGIWDTIWDKESLNKRSAVFNRFGKTWYEAIDAPGGQQMQYFRKFYEENEFHKLSPVELKASEMGFSTVMQAHASANHERSRYVIYYSNYAISSYTVSNVPDGTYEMKWFNPRTGEYTPCGSFSPVYGEWVTPEAPDLTDWLLVAERTA